MAALGAGLHTQLDPLTSLGPGDFQTATLAGLNGEVQEGYESLPQGAAVDGHRWEVLRQGKLEGDAVALSEAGHQGTHAPHYVLQIGRAVGWQ